MLLMTGKIAENWAVQFKNDMEKHRQPGGAAVSWRRFKQKVITDFSGVDEGRHAKFNLIKLRQDQDGLTTREYIQIFKQYAPLTEFNDVALVEFFKEGLNQELRVEILKRDTLPEDLDEWCELAQRLNDNFVLAKAAERNYTRPIEPTTDLTKIYGKKPRGPRMAGRAAQTEMPRRQGRRWTPEQVELYNNNLCFGCKKPGHRAKDCPQRTNPGMQARGANTNASSDAYHQMERLISQADSQTFEEIGQIFRREDRDF